MTLMERPIVSLMVESPSGADLAWALRPRFARLLGLDHSGWMRQLAADGFSGSDINRLEDFISERFDETELTEKLASILRGAQDFNDESEVDAALDHWLARTGWVSIWEQVHKANFPDPIDAAAYAGARLLQMASSTLEFESLRRNSTGQQSDWTMWKSQVQEGIELAEAGLAEEAAEWPPY